MNGGTDPNILGFHRSLLLSCLHGIARWLCGSQFQSSVHWILTTCLLYQPFAHSYCMWCDCLKYYSQIQNTLYGLKFSSEVKLNMQRAYAKTKNIVTVAATCRNKKFMPILFGIIILLCLLINMCFYYHSEHNPLNTMHSYTTTCFSHHPAELQ